VVSLKTTLKMVLKKIFLYGEVKKLFQKVLKTNFSIQFMDFFVFLTFSLQNIINRIFIFNFRCLQSFKSCFIYHTTEIDFTDLLLLFSLCTAHLHNYSRTSL